MDMNPLPYDEKEYNPGESSKLAEWSPGGLRDESEILYKTAKGNFFILIRAGMIARIQNMQGEGGWLEGSRIRPVTPEEARAWCEETGSYEVMDEQFPSVR